MCIGVKPKDEIIVPAFGWISASELLKFWGQCQYMLMLNMILAIMTKINQKNNK